MAQARARYDDFAEWYEQWICGLPPLIASQASLLPGLAGDRVLDIGCGQGRLSRHLASLGAEVTGIDISAEMLGRARAAGRGNITYIHADVTAPSAWWDGQPFDRLHLRNGADGHRRPGGRPISHDGGAAPGRLVRRLGRASVPSWHRAGCQQLAARTRL
jgi:SAM-dependent methyltransferase